MTQKKIKFKAKFKKVDLFNTTIHIILYPEDGLRTASKLYEFREGDEIEVVVSA
jgi:hypothetical protein